MSLLSDVLCEDITQLILPGDELMQGLRPDNADPIPLRRSQQGVGMIMVRFVGLLAAATVVMALIWSR
jgi:hypothetical protein